MALEPGAENIHAMGCSQLSYATKEEVFSTTSKNLISGQQFMCQSEWRTRFAQHWHDVDNCGYVMEGKSYVLTRKRGQKMMLDSVGAGDKLIRCRPARFTPKSR